MNLLFKILTVLFTATLSLSYTFGQIQCTNDVTIDEGDNISFCQGTTQTISASSGYINYLWTGPETVSGQTITPGFSGEYVVAALDGDGCVSQDTINVTIFPNPADVILSSNGSTLCDGGTTTLSLANSYTSYDWGNSITTPTLDVTTAGTYNVTVVDNNGCIGLSSINIGAANFELEIGEGSLCHGGTILTASGGQNYLWSTGETSNSIVVAPESPTVYNVTITSGSCVEMLSQTVDPPQFPPYNLPDTMYVAPSTNSFVPGPPDFISYSWSPTTQIDNPNSQGVFFNGDTTQLLTVSAVYEDGCIFTDNVLVIVVELTIPNGFSPNSDGLNDAFKIPELDSYPGNVTVWNRWGDIVFEQENYQNNWMGTCETGACLGSGALPEGTYFYAIDVSGITFRGYLTLKR